jgi:hypothetical protein
MKTGHGSYPNHQITISYTPTPSMTTSYIQVDLAPEEKVAILKYADFFLDETTKADLLNKRKKWIRFKKYVLSEVIGELSYHCNRCKDNCMLGLLDELICHLEYYERQAK